MKKMLWLLVFVPVFALGKAAYSCTAFVVSDGKTILVGNNEDFWNPLTKVWFVPSKEGSFGRIYFGYDDFSPQGGMNDQGLFFDGFATAPVKVTRSLQKEKFKGLITDTAMATCATVEEVIQLFQKYNLAFLERAMLMFADKTGDAVIIEGDEFLRKKGRYQIVTNFYQSMATPGAYPCRRYNKAEKLLTEGNEVSLDLCRRILDATHAEGRAQTLYSNVYDLKKGIAYLYYFHDFETEVKFDLKEELKKGARHMEIPSLFPRNSTAESFASSNLKAMEKRKATKRSNQVSPEGFDAYVGEYQLIHDLYENINILVSKEGDQLFVGNSLTPGKDELIPNSEACFYVVTFFKDTKLTFQKDEKGRVNGVNIESSLGEKFTAKKIE